MKNVCIKCGSTEFIKSGKYTRCKPCARAKSKIYELKRDREKTNARVRLDRKLNPEKYKEKERRNYINNLEKKRSAMAKYYRDNPDRHRTEKALSLKAAYRKNNPAKIAAYTRKYYASKLNATPSWANKFFIEEIYDLAQRRTKCLGIEHHVDHIVPLQSKLVCGLHVEHNLRVITASLNKSKRNSYWSDMP